MNKLTRSSVPDTFDLVAESYDLQVNLNPGYHANLRRAAEALLAAIGSPNRQPARLLDLGCGSGASTKALALAAFQAGCEPELLGADGSAGMLAAARRKSWPSWVRFEQARADQLQLQGECFDGILASYLVRNVDDRERLIGELFDLLTPGGALAVHDYAVRGNAFAGLLWTIVCWSVVIPLGWATSRHTKLYRYLWRSAFDLDVRILCELLENAGFVDVSVTPALGWARGTLHTVVGRRP